MLKWFSRLDPKNIRVCSQPYGVWLGGFRESTHTTKYLANKRRDELNENN